MPAVISSATSKASDTEQGLITTASAVMMGAIAPLVLGLAPVLVGAMVERLGFSPSQAGLVISAHLGGIGLIGLPMALVVHRPVWRGLLALAIPVLAALFALAAFVHDPTRLALTLFGAGLAGGVAVSITLPIMARSTAPTTAFAWWVLLQLALGAAGVALAPWVLARHGLAGMFLILAGVMAAMALMLPFIPRGPRAQAGSQINAPHTPGGQGALGLFGLYAFYVAVGAVWTYYERIGDAAGLQGPEIARALSLATLSGVAGAGLASLTPLKLGRTGPVCLGVAALLSALGLLMGPLGVWGFLSSAVLFKLAWTFTLPFLLGSLSAVDASGRLLVLANIIIGLGLASGPAIAAGLVGPGQFTGVLGLGGAGMALSAGAFLALNARLRRA